MRKIYDLTSCGPVIDRNGCWPCKNNVESALVVLHRDYPRFKKTSKVLVLQTQIKYLGPNPVRQEIVVERRVWTLLRYYREEFGDEFDLETAISNIDFRLIDLEKQGEKANAWGAYIYVTNVRNAMRKASVIAREESGNSEKIKERLKKEGIDGILRPFL